jgi:transitional endoplasmic reticulum ATPase
MRDLDTPLPSVGVLWALRGLVHLNTQKEFVGEDGFTNEDLAKAIGLGDFIPKKGEEERFNRHQMFFEIRQRLNSAESRIKEHQIPENLVKNMATLQKITGMTDLECRILEFAIMTDGVRAFDCFTELSTNVKASEVPKHLAAYLSVPAKEIHRTLSRKSALVRSGLLSISCDETFMPYLGDYLRLVSYNFSDQMLSEECDFDAVFSDMVLTSTAPELALSDFSYLGEKVELVCLYLKSAINSKKKGVNVLLYGKPGVGKTQFAKAVAHEIGIPILEIANEDQDGFPLNGQQRFQAFCAAQAFFCRNDSLLMFDEIEDVFYGNPTFNQLLGSNKSNAVNPGMNKAWVNHTLEENKIPTFWISNSVEGTLDPAYVRRFDLVIEMPIPSCEQRYEMVSKICGEHVKPETVKNLSAAEELAPAVISRAMRVIKTIHSDIDVDSASKFTEMMVDATLSAQSFKGLGKTNSTVEFYDPTIVNASYDMSGLAQGIKHSRSGRFLLTGAPGTGKTGYGHWLANEIKAPILVKKGSDLLGPYVGQSEKNIAEAFAEAKASKAVLLIDEVDSFLSKRTNAIQSWEVALVNQVLVELAEYTGVFIATTNLEACELDPAALRRFDLKVKFDYLCQEQSTLLLEKHCTKLGICNPTPRDYQALKNLLFITPGDFAVVANQSRFATIKTAEAFIEALKVEHDVKGLSKNSIGFMSKC